MQIKTGIDIIFLPRFVKLIQDPKFVAKIFTSIEIEKSSNQSLAGIFAIKEAVFKVLNQNIQSWLQIEVNHDNNGKPYIDNINGWQFDVSISHDQNYVIASVVAIKNNL